MHSIFKDYLSKELNFSGRKNTKDKVKSLATSYSKDEEIIEDYKQLLKIYCEEELAYQINAMQDAYQAFQDIINIKEEDMFKEIMAKGTLGLRDREIREFFRDKKDKKDASPVQNAKDKQKANKEEQKQ